MLINGMDVDYEEDEDYSPKNHHMPDSYIQETDDLDFVLHILYKRKRKLSKKGKLSQKLDSCISRIKFLKNIDDEYEWLCREKAMLQCSYDQANEEITNSKYVCKDYDSVLCKKQCIVFVAPKDESFVGYCLECGGIVDWIKRE